MKTCCELANEAMRNGMVSSHSCGQMDWICEVHGRQGYVNSSFPYREESKNGL